MQRKSFLAQMKEKKNSRSRPKRERAGDTEREKEKREEKKKEKENEVPGREERERGEMNQSSLVVKKGETDG